MSRRLIFLAASIIVSLIFLWLALRGVPLSEVWDGIRQADPLWIALSFGGMALSAITRAIRWRGLIADRAPLVGVLHTYNIAMLLNLLPLRAGEVARAVVLSTRFGVPLFTAATSVVVERLLDILMIVLILTIGLSRVDSAPAFVTNGALIFAAITVVGFAVLIILARTPQLTGRLLAWLESRLPILARLHLLQRLQEVLTGLEFLRSAGRLAHLVVWSILSWAASLFTFYCLERALDLPVAGIDPVIGAFLGVPLASLSIAIPVSVASIGPFESAVRVAGDLVGMSAASATTLGFLFHGVAALGYVAFGVISVLALGISLTNLTRPVSGEPK